MTDRGMTMTRMFAAVLVYEATSSRAGHAPLFEETVTLLLADSPEHAAEKAREHAESRETSYRNAAGDTITWSFRHLVDVTEVNDPLVDGAEVYTRHFSDYRAYLAVEPLAS